MSGEALCGMGGELAGQPTMVKPVVEFRFMAPCSVLAWGCGGTTDGGGAWKPLPKPAWEIGMAAVSTGGGATGAGGAGSAGKAGGCCCCCCKVILLWCCFRLLGRKLPTITCHAKFYFREPTGYI